MSVWTFLNTQKFFLRFARSMSSSTRLDNREKLLEFNGVIIIILGYHETRICYGYHFNFISRGNSDVGRENVNR